MLKSKLQAALQEGMTLVESVQLLELQKSDLERNIRELQDEQAKRVGSRAFGCFFVEFELHGSPD